jgi:hypothetical protein
LLSRCNGTGKKQKERCDEDRVRRNAAVELAWVHGWTPKGYAALLGGSEPWLAAEVVIFANENAVRFDGVN